jgi:hypothetical protein
MQRPEWLTYQSFSLVDVEFAAATDIRATTQRPATQPAARSAAGRRT